VKFIVEASFLEAAYQTPKETARKIWKALNLLSSNPQHPGLHLENLKGNASGLQSVRVDDKYRIIISPNHSTPTLLYVGLHDDAYAFAEKVYPSVSLATLVATKLYSIATPPAPMSMSPNIIRTLLLRTIRYLPLATFLLSQSEFENRVEVRFSRIEQIIKASLPISARKHRAWWANERSGGRHAQANAWVSIGWRVFSVDLKSETVIFSRLEQPINLADTLHRT